MVCQVRNEDIDMSYVDLSFIMFMTIIYKKEEFEKRNQY